MDAKDAIIENEPTKPFLVESKLYRLNADENLLAFLEPDMQTKMQVELILDESFPREEKDGDDTRIFINFTNLKGNGTPFLITDDQRLNRRYDLDGFINGFFGAVNEGVQEDIALEIVPASLVNGINTAIINTLELSAERQLPAVKLASEVILKSLIAVLYNDPADVMILLQEQPLRDGQSETDANIVGIWTVKSRD